MRTSREPLIHHMILLRKTRQQIRPVLSPTQASSDALCELELLEVPPGCPGAGHVRFLRPKLDEEQSVHITRTSHVHLHLLRHVLVDLGRGPRTKRFKEWDLASASSAGFGALTDSKRYTSNSQSAKGKYSRASDTETQRNLA